MCLPHTALALDWPGRAADISARIVSLDPEVRAAAASDLGTLDADEAQEMLSAALVDPSPMVRAAACDSVGATGAVELEVLLQRRLADRSPDVRARAARALGSLRTPGAHDALARVLADPDPDVRSAAVSALANLGRVDALLPITSTLQDTSRVVVVAALEALARLGHPGSLFAMLEKIGDPHAEVALAAVNAVAALRAPEATPALVQLVTSPRQELALAAVEALGEIADSAAAPALVAIAHSHEGDPTLRNAAMVSLASIADPTTVGGLLAMADRDSAGVGVVLRAIGPAGWPALRRAGAATADGSRAHEGLLRAWLASDDPEAVEAALRWSRARTLEDAELIALLQASRAESAVCRVADIVADAPWLVDEAADVWLEWAGSVSTPCIGPFVAAYTMGDLDRHAEIARTLMMRGNPTGSAFALEVVERAPGSPAAARAVSALARGGAAARRVAIQLLNHREVRIRREAAAALAGSSAGWLSAEIFAELRQVEDVAAAAVALLGEVHGEHADEVAAWGLSLAESSEPAAAAAGLALLDGRCDEDAVRVATGLSRSEHYWLRREAGLLLSRCRPSAWQAHAETVHPGVEHDPVIRAARAPGGPAECAANATNSTLSTDERVRAVACTEDAEQLLRLCEDKRAAIAAAAWLRREELGSAGHSADLALRSVAGSEPLVRAALYFILESRGDLDALRHPRRRESDESARRLLRGPSAAYSAPLVVFAVDRQSGTPSPDTSIAVIDAEGRLIVRRTQLSGVAVFRDAPVRFATVVD